MLTMTWSPMKILWGIGNRREAIARVAKDVIQRMNLPLHGHIYDGAANMAGKFNKGKSGKSRQTDTGKETSTTGTHI